MVVFGSAADHMSSFGGNCSVQVGLSDCGDASGVSIGFAYWGCLAMDLQLDTERVAFHTLGALGYGWGLENIAGNGQVMSSWSNSALKFGEACANINGGSGCAHEGCGMGQQNSSADLIANLGARVDDGPPELVVIEPQPGADVTSPFDVVVEVNDGFGGITAQLEVVELGAPPVVDAAYPYRWNGLDLGAGPTALTLLVTATDADGNEVSTEIPVCLGGGCPDPGDGDGDTGDGDGDGDGGETGGGETGGDTAAADAGDAKGCAVEQRGAGGLGALVLLGLFGVVRRRRGEND
jgi:MYXO-CTERM domain-containing protein